MQDTVIRYVRSLNTRKFTRNVERVLHTLLVAALTGDGWVSSAQISRVPSGTSRVRELRTEEFGGFTVMARSAPRLGRPGTANRFFYRLNQSNLTVDRLRMVFGQ